MSEMRQEGTGGGPERDKMGEREVTSIGFCTRPRVFRDLFPQSEAGTRTALQNPQSQSRKSKRKRCREEEEEEEREEENHAPRQGNGTSNPLYALAPDPDCHRNGKNAKKKRKNKKAKYSIEDLLFEETDNTYQPVEVCFNQAENLIMKLTSGSYFGIFNQDCDRWVSSFHDNLMGKPWLDCERVLSESSLAGLAERCERGEGQGEYMKDQGIEGSTSAWKESQFKKGGRQLAGKKSVTIDNQD
ncbi:hypothetical protein K435DRAFT_804735 [Dendrothele bispora CBS 962.96]|uniref:Uncharacterized protein n=1 Tax=Dendrothele bispora (strain CBS 962.96) TaxID=1314807 RepID=A0A4S8LE20_DENBC|nr:hypothetical protein K435DRAFT_804735 [Dendrothele bispora CBS 962.96]